MTANYLYFVPVIIAMIVIIFDLTRTILSGKYRGIFPVGFFIAVFIVSLIPAINIPFIGLYLYSIYRQMTLAE